MMNNKAWTAACKKQRALYPELGELVSKTRRYGRVIDGPDHLALFDRRRILDNLVAWEDLWRDLQGHLPSDLYDEFVALREGLSAGPTLSGTDSDLLLYLDEAANAWSSEGLEASPPDPTVADRLDAIYAAAVVFAGTPGEAIEFLRGVLEGRDYDHRH
jgi:hypothetical protein